ncbi:TIGR04283 family arsenosugar biosynthesis glycosyltransferase [Maribacter algicola]|uniref:TIGR04283 family arsenosugar biosynthesis glycosyltransferase n=1 Tax=Meishania litoralis TaxID=3434685 RepID=A0ACC7LJT8_9FLAO
MISIIIPVINEEMYLGRLLEYLGQHTSKSEVREILVVDGGSNDDTITVAKNFGATVIESKKGRAKQMNTGAKFATGELLYFLHVDTFPPPDFTYRILQAQKNGSEAGCFRMRFDSQSRFLKFFAWFTRINHPICRGGDQSLFISKDLFEKTNGFNEAYIIYEDVEFVARLYSKTDFMILPQYVKTSARKYRKKGMLRLQYHFGIIHLKNYLGEGPEKLYDYYQRKIAL